MRKVFILFLLFLLSCSSLVLYGQQTQKAVKKPKPILVLSNLNGPDNFVVVGDQLYFSEYNSGIIYKLDADSKSKTELTGGLDHPAGMVEYDGQIYVLEFGAGKITKVDPSSGNKSTIADGFKYPADIEKLNDVFYVSEYGEGKLWKVSPSGNKSILAEGLSAPSGLAVRGESILFAEWGMGRVSEWNGSTVEVLVNKGLSSPWDIEIKSDTIYVSERGGNEISYLRKLPQSTVDSLKQDLERNKKPGVIDLDITNWVAESYINSDLKSPEGMGVYKSDLFIAEKKANEISKIVLNHDPTGVLLLEGEVKYKRIAVAVPKNIEDLDGLGTFVYSWEISGDNGSNWYTVADNVNDDEYKIMNEDYIGKYLRARIDYVDGMGVKETIFSDSKMITDKDAPIVNLTILPTNRAKPGEQVNLSADVEIVNGGGKIEKVEFYANGELLGTATAAPYIQPLKVNEDIDYSIVDNQRIILTAKVYDNDNDTAEDFASLFVVTSDSEDIPEDINKSNGLAISPNPVGDILNMSGIDLKGSYMLKVYNFNGQLILNKEKLSGSTISIPISNIRAGIYIAEISNGQDTKYVKFIKGK